MLMTKPRPKAFTPVQPQPSIVGHPSPIATRILMDIADCFPIGGKMGYYLGSQQGGMSETTVVAYSLNDHLIYTQKGLYADAPGGLSIDPESHWLEHEVGEVQQVCLYVPYIAETIPSIAAEPFKSGARLTLASMYTLGCIPQVECVVRDRVEMAEGHYRAQAMDVLEIDAGTFRRLDRRQHARIGTHIPAFVKTAERAVGQEGTLLDFTDLEVKVQLVKGAKPFAPFDRLIVTIDLSETAGKGQPQQFTFMGKVVRRERESLVLELVGQLKQNGFCNIELMDRIDLKASLLQHPATDHPPLPG